MDIINLISLLALTYFIGSVIEKKHFEKIKKREISLIKKPVITLDNKIYNQYKPIKRVRLVTGEVVLSGDFFKTYVASLKNFFGGRLTTFESILDRARREAILRMRESAKDADCVMNVRLETIMLNDFYSNKGTIPKCAVIAYGTAVIYER